MSVHAHCYDFGAHPLALHDRLVELLAVGAVLATAAWLRAQSSALSLEDLRVRYCEAPAYRGDAGVQHVRLGPQLEGQAATCLDLAIFEAARLQVAGVEAWVEIVRASDDAAGHAVVALPSNPGSVYDPTALFLSSEAPCSV